jgi:hypothetical protein
MILASAALLAEEATRLRFEWGRIQSNADWVLPVAAALALMLFVRTMYRRDAVELNRYVGWLLTGLRTAAVLGALILYADPRWRTEREVVENSRALVLVDTSLSMALSDGGTAQAPTRSGQAAAALAQTDFLGQLRRTHDVVVMRFDEAVKRIVSLGKLGGEAQRPGAEDNGQETSPGSASPSLPGETIEARIDWDEALRPSGKETRLGQALRQVIGEERGAPVAGIVVLSDGGQNAGTPPETAIELAAEAKIPIFPVGFGSTERQANVRVHELDVPERAHPGDPYSVAGLIQAEGLTGQSVTVQLAVRDPAKGVEQVVQTQQVVLGRDGETVPVRFQVTPTDSGRRQIVLRLVAPPGDRNPADNQREAEIEIVDRKNRVLLMAGAASREYQFLKALLFRDKSTIVDVLLQTGAQGISQEASKVLSAFPATREELFAYDCLVAFDPDWQALTGPQVDLLETWVAEQGGGLIVTAGPVHAGQAVGGWVAQPALAKIRALYPVELHRRPSVIDAEAHAASDPWPLAFTREGLEAEFLWLADTETASRQAWAEFRGVYGCHPVRGPKPGATVYARFADPQAASPDRQTVYLAGQFYGSGRVFYLGSAEMWRLRRIDERCFEQFYMRLLRHVSQGRLLRQSPRGSLLVDKARYLLGNTVEIRAQLTNAQLQPLASESVPLEVVPPDRGVQTVLLRSDPTRPGIFTGQLTVLQEGTYRLELPVPESDNERLTRRLQVRVPDLERENPQRNDALLGRLAEGTGGRYYRDPSDAWGPASADPLAAQLSDRTKTSVLPAPNPLQQRQWLKAMMLALCGVLSAEWLIRRLMKLA